MDADGETDTSAGVSGGSDPDAEGEDDPDLMPVDAE